MSEIVISVILSFVLTCCSYFNGQAKISIFAAVKPMKGSAK